MLEVLIHAFFGGGTSGFWGGQVVLVIHMSVGQVDFFTKFEPCLIIPYPRATHRSDDLFINAAIMQLATLNLHYDRAAELWPKSFVNRQLFSLYAHFLSF